MNVKKTTFLLSTLLAVTAIGLTKPIDTANAAPALSWSKYFDCSVSKERRDEINNPTTFKKYLESLGQDYSITVNGKKLTANPSYAINQCILVYGKPEDVTMDGRIQQDKKSGQPKYLGYDANRRPYANPAYPDLTTSVDYVKTSDFIKNPWSDPKLQADIKKSVNKPYTKTPSQTSTNYIDGVKYTKAQEINRAVDRFYLLNCKNDPKEKDCGRKSRGFFPATNTKTKVKMTGENLLKYASVNSFPTKYTAGTFELYRKYGNGYRFATFVMPPYDEIGTETRDLQATITSISSTNPIGGEKLTVKYKVCNKGSGSVTKPVVHYGIENKAVTKKELNTTLKAGSCTSEQSFTATTSKVTKETTKKVVIEVNQNKKNPVDENNWTNNVSEKSYKVRPEIKDLSLSITSIQTPVKEGNEFTVKYQVCNNGNYAVKNPVVSYGEKGGSYKTTTVNTTINPGKCTTQTVTDTTPFVSKQTKLDYELTVNKDKKNPTNEKTYTNNTDNKTLTVNPGVRDLALTINTIQTPVVEGEEFDVKYTVCNKGEGAVKDPVVSYGEKGGEYQNTTIKTTLAPGKCTTQTVTDEAPSVSKDSTVDYELNVNKNKKNPENETNYKNNTDDKPLKVLDDIKNGSVTIKDHKPDVPHSNQDITVKVEVCNHSLAAAKDVQVSYGFAKGKKATSTIKSIASGDCEEITHKTTTPEVNGPSGNVIYQATLDKFKGDSDSSDNKDTDKINVKNPDAKVSISTSAGSSSQVSDINVKFTNNMLSTIKDNCKDTGTIACNGSTRTGTVVRIYDTKFTDTKTDDVLVKTYYPKYSLKAGNSSTYKIKSDDMVNYVQTRYKDALALVEFRVEAEMPYYKGEITYQGQPSYDNNQDVETLVYSPVVPNVEKCNVLDHQITTYFTTKGGQNPIKMCAGHYPTYPSTTVESGMQAYHYVLYRFLPSPLPKYTVTTPGTDQNSFFQLFNLPSTEGKNQLGDFETMYFPNKTVNGFYQERGRYLPTGGTFNYRIYENRKNGDGDNIALGTVTYKIDSNCYNTEALDIKHHSGCSETIFYLPNSDTVNKHKVPGNYLNNKVVYPINNSKIPYLNPGSYTFEFTAHETFQYYYQTNESTSGYQWSNPKPKFK